MVCVCANRKAAARRYACRDLADPLYAILTRAMFQSIERISSADTKHGERLRLENYIFFQTALKGQADRNPVLAYFVRLAEENKQHSVQVGNSILG